MNNLCLKLKKSYLFKDIDLEILEKILNDLQNILQNFAYLK